MADILVAEADRVERELIARAVAGAGHRAIVVADGDEALVLAEAAHIDAAIAGLDLPKRDGYALLLRLHAGARTAATPVVLVSDAPALVHAPIAASLGAAAYVEKPWSAADLIEALGALPGADDDRREESPS